jgi:F0F1-type ATP synthase delta subunit
MFARFARTFANVQMKYTPEGRYAYTLFTVATSAGNVDKVATDMQFLHDLFAESEEMRTFLKNPVLKSE